MNEVTFYNLKTEVIVKFLKYSHVRLGKTFHKRCFQTRGQVKRSHYKSLLTLSLELADVRRSLTVRSPFDEILGYHSRIVDKRMVVMVVQINHSPDDLFLAHKEKYLLKICSLKKSRVCLKHGFHQYPQCISGLKSKFIS